MRFPHIHELVCLLCNSELSKIVDRSEAGVLVECAASSDLDIPGRLLLELGKSRRGNIPS